MAGFGEARTAALRDALGDAAEVLDPPLRLAGGRLGLRVEPADGDALAAALRTLDAAGAPALLMGGGSRMELGNPVRDARVLLSCRRLRGIDELDAADGVVHVAAGTPLTEIAEAVEAAGWLLPLDPPGEGSTLGGALASGATGPRRLGFGAARDCVLGLDTVLPGGERTRCGGRVVKNVTGYDLAKLYVGSLGTLAVIEGAWLRLRPRPRAVEVVVLELRDDEDPHGLALAAARAPAARAVALLSRDRVEARAEATSGEPAGLAGGGATLAPFSASDARWRLVAEYAGDEPVTRESASRLAEHGSAVAADDTAVAALRDLEAWVPPVGVRARLHVLPTRIPACCDALRAAGAALLAQPEPGLIFATFDPAGRGEDDPWWLDGVFAALDRVRAEMRAEIVVEALPEWGHGRRDVFMGRSGPLSLMRAIKARFDPRGILNPGRFAGSI